MYINSKNVKMFPAQSRSDYWDRQSKMTNEQNLVSIVNRVVGKESFIIEGLDITMVEGVQKITPGSCNIGGYLFNIHSEINLSNITPSETATELYLGIRVQKSKISTTGNLPYVELSKILPYDSKNTSLDSVNDPNNDYFYGIDLTTTTLKSTEEYDYKYLQIARANGSKWESVNASIGSNFSSKNVARFKYDGSDILVENKNVNSKDVDNTANAANVNLSLDWYLQSYYSIDDGDLG